MFKNMLILAVIIGIAMLTASCGVKRDLRLPEGTKKETVL
jgi:hypothetical protein